jgi:hypothetical protein
MSLADTAAGYLLVLVFFPLFGAGLGAWGALYTAGRASSPATAAAAGAGASPSPPHRHQTVDAARTRTTGRPSCVAT